MGCCVSSRRSPEGADLPEYDTTQREWSKAERDDMVLMEKWEKVRLWLARASAHASVYVTCACGNDL